MRNPLPTVADAQSWHELYRAALFETDKQMLPSRIAEAERALILRGRELFEVPDNSEEADAVDDALYALRALRSCIELKTNEPNAA